MSETISGSIEHIIFRNEENGYTVLEIATEDGEVTCVGNLADVHEGILLSAKGRRTTHAVYGEQFRIEEYEMRIPDRGDAFERYLASGAIKGIGARLAARIIERFGEDAARIIEEEPERLAEVKGISMRKAQEIAAQANEQAQARGAMVFLAGYDIPLTLAVRIYNQYGEDLYSVLRENPYRLAEDISGVGFRIADRIASRVGIRPDSAFRIRSGLLYLLRRAGGEGHIYLPRNVLLQNARELLGVAEEDAGAQLTDLVIEKKIVLRPEPEDKVYLAPMYYMELQTARMLRELNIVCAHDDAALEARIAHMERDEEITLDDLQKQAVRAAAANGLMILTGGPGTGKTTTMGAMIRYFRAEQMQIALAAPTGRAAKRMTEATGCEASTIHRLLGISGGTAEEGEMYFEHDTENPLETDVVIIDEASMMDCYLLHALLLAIRPGTRLILVGDVNQLPSVGPGSVLKDMIRAEFCTVIRLQSIFRQAAKSDIVMNAHRINRGEEIVLDNKSEDFFFLQRDDVQVIQRVVLSLVSEKLPGYVHADPFDIQVLTPMRKGPLGVITLNAILQRYLNPPAPGKEECEVGQTILREGDKVMQVRNNYQMEWVVRGVHGIIGESGTGIFNGDMGVVRLIDRESETVEVAFDEDRTALYAFSQLDELELAYAVTIHKSQGSEYPAVVIPLLAGPPMLMTRNLLYTAVTRARSCVVLAGTKETFYGMVSNATEIHRYTSLDARIREIS